ncbi:MAG: diaminopimelate epimerase [Elusimicrobiota bacterium]|jgi:diaminopimelate epimerase|nr:diaminopimelate epimerase [Elusimicrobiota bacterium]
MKINFSKLTAAGNDFVLIDNRKGLVEAKNYQKLAAKLCDRKYSIGADGLIFVEESKTCDFKMKYFNSDGSFAAMCGNGGRSIAKFAYEIGAAKNKMTFETDAGIISAEVTAPEIVKLQLYEPKNLRRDIKLNIEGRDFDIDFINTGVPHAVIFVDDIEKIDVFKCGKFLRFHKEFAPEGTNVDFVQVSKDNTILVRTYERGVEGETLACGTGIIASAIIAGLKNFVKSPIKIIARGGDKLSVSYQERDGKIKNVILEGPAVISFEGTVKI